MYSDTQLDAFLDEALPPEMMAEIEAAMRDDESLKERLATIVGRRDAGLHSLGAIWRRRRLTCPTREQLGSRLLGVLDPALDEYVTFHLEVVGCRVCQASLADLQQRSAAEEATGAAARRQRYFQSSAGLLHADDDD
ncbi:MAG: hypothetical protein CMJ58_02610 [Planctomycetaceae bacterium]|nr:hypothetical protein [Planctomycetaceae bacterium]